MYDADECCLCLIDIAQSKRNLLWPALYSGKKEVLEYGLEKAKDKIDINQQDRDVRDFSLFLNSLEDLEKGMYRFHRSDLLIGLYHITYRDRNGVH